MLTYLAGSPRLIHRLILLMLQSSSIPPPFGIGTTEGSWVTALSSKPLFAGILAPSRVARMIPPKAFSSLWQGMQFTLNIGSISSE
jgi:hypothetical protein